MQRGLDGADGDAQLFGDRLDALTQEVVHHDDFALTPRQSAERGAHVDSCRDIDRRIGVVGPGLGDESPARTSFRIQASQPADSEIASHDTHPGFENVDLMATTKTFNGPCARFVDSIPRQILIAGHEGKRRDQPRVGEDIEVVEPVLAHTRELWHGRYDAPDPGEVAFAGE